MNDGPRGDLTLSVIKNRAAFPLLSSSTAIAAVPATKTAVAQAEPELMVAGLLSPTKWAVLKRPRGATHISRIVAKRTIMRAVDARMAFVWRANGRGSRAREGPKNRSVRAEK